MPSITLPTALPLEQPFLWGTSTYLFIALSPDFTKDHLPVSRIPAGLSTSIAVLCHELPHEVRVFEAR